MRRLVGFLAVIALGVAGGYGGYELLTSEPNEIRLTVNPASGTVTVNQTFTLEIEVENVDVNAAVQVNGVELDQSLLDGLAVESLTINGQEVFQPGGTQTRYDLDQALAGGAKMLIRYTLRATQPGTYRGDAKVWVDSQLLGSLERSKARTESITIRVQ